MSVDQHPHLKPRLRLFLSVDIVGSTALKQSPVEEDKLTGRSAWFQKIQGFYFEAQKEFLERFKEGAKDSNPELYGPLPKVWKTIGDEILFYKELTDHRQLVTTLRHWMGAMDELRTFIQKGTPRLDIKCTAWLAGFPFKNAEIVIDTEASTLTLASEDWNRDGNRALELYYASGEAGKGLVIDFIGPSIDIGFRLQRFSTSRKFIVSVGISYILSLANPEGDRDRVFNVYYEGSHELKGVFGGIKYPVFWLDMSDAHDIAIYEDRLTRIAPVNRDSLREYCKQFYATNGSHTFPPFIISDTEGQLIEKPVWYDNCLSEMVGDFDTGDEQVTGFDKGDEAADATDPQVAEKMNEIINEFLHSMKKPNED